MLKILAAVLMLIDHIGAVFFPQYLWLRMIGRLSMPLFAYAIATGYYFTARSDASALSMARGFETAAKAASSTDGAQIVREPSVPPQRFATQIPGGPGVEEPRSRRLETTVCSRLGRFPKYLLQMVGFAAVSQIPFYLMISQISGPHFSLNIGATWVLALVLLRGVVGIRRTDKDGTTRRLWSPGEIGWILAAVVAVILAMEVPMDYGLYGILYPLACYGIVLGVRNRADFKTGQNYFPTIFGYSWGVIGQAILNFWGGLFMFSFWPLQALALVSVPLMSFDSGKKSTISKWFFYIFYPLHMLLLVALAWALRR